MGENNYRLEKFLAVGAPYMVGIAFIIVIIASFELNRASERVRETEAYTRVSNCIVAKVASPPTDQEAVELCYAQVEKSTGLDLERFGYQVEGQNTRQQQ